MLSGVYGFDESILDHNKIFQDLLINIHEARRDIFKDSTYLEDTRLDQQGFDELLLRIFRTAFNYWLNEVNPEQSDKKSLELLDMYNDETKLKNKDERTVENFVASYFESKKVKFDSLSVMTTLRLKIYVAWFYRFCEVDINQLLFEIEFFNENSGSVIFKIKNLLSLKNLRRVTTKYYQLVSNALSSGAKNMRLENIFVFNTSIYILTKETGEKSVALVKTKYLDLKHWISTSAQGLETRFNPFIKPIKEYSSKIYEATLKATEVPRTLLVNRIILPVVNYSVKLSNNSLDFAINTYSLGREKQRKLWSISLNKFMSYSKVLRDHFLERSNSSRLSMTLKKINISVSRLAKNSSLQILKDWLTFLIDLLRVSRILNLKIQLFKYTLRLPIPLSKQRITLSIRIEDFWP